MASFNTLCLARDIVGLVRRNNARDARNKQIDSARAMGASLEDETVAELSVEMITRSLPAHDDHRSLTARKEAAQTQPASVHDDHRALKEVAQTTPPSKARPKFEL